MRKTALVSLLAVALLLAAALPGYAWGGWHGHGRVFVGVGPAWWGPPYPYWGYYSPRYYVYPPPAVVVQEPPVYIAQPPAAPPPPQSYWYYCPSAQGYYPSVATCPEAWIKVPPRSE